MNENSSVLSPRDSLTFRGLNGLPGYRRGTVCTFDEGDLSVHLMSDQCPVNINIASYHYGTIANLSGCIILQIHEAMRVLNSINPLMMPRHFPGNIHRFPRQAVIEAICNAAIHSDFRTIRQLSITVSDEFMFIDSPGGMDIRPGSSETIFARNQGLASVMRDMGMVTLQMRGLMKMRLAYQYTSLKPVIRDERRWVVVKLPSVSDGMRCTSAMEGRILGYIVRNPGSQVAEISDGLCITPNAITAILDRMEASETIFSMGRSSSRRYFVV